MKLTLEDRIRERAYFLSLSGGGAGDATHFWLIAEQEALAEAAKESTVASPEAIRSVQAAKPTAVVQAIRTACLGAILHVSKHRQLFVLQSCKPTRRRLEAASRYSPQPTSLHPM
jgi:hypothetical protein